MKNLFTPIVLTILFHVPASWGQIEADQTIGRFNQGKDLLLVQFDCKTDVDDLHTVAAFVTLMSHRDFTELDYHAVAGTYGIQEGLYVPPENLFQLAFGDNWTDAHANFDTAVMKVTQLVMGKLNQEGNIWIAEAGQSDFSAALIRSIQQAQPDLDTNARIHIVQHSNWNEEVTSEQDLAFVKKQATYHKISDGNAVGNGTPGFKTPAYQDWKTLIKDEQLKAVWELAVDLGLKYNAKDGRYNNKAVAANGLDFSDLSETCWILGLEDILDTSEFFERFGR